jgi:peptidoglycan/xylan/chitin deacetylase (PgdA/CDA1 family)
MYAGLALIDHTLIGWGWWLWDWDWFRAPAPERLVRRFAGRVSGGDIIVMHDGHHEDPRADRRYAVDATLRLIPLLRDQGFAFGTICSGP